MKKQNGPKIKKLMSTTLPHSKFELSDEQIEKFKNVGEIILGLGAVAGLAAVTVVAPNALQLIKKVPWSHTTYRSSASKKRDQRDKMTKAFYYLKREGYVELIPKGDDFLMKITEKGREKVAEMSLRNLKIKKTSNWGGFWWMIIGDIPTEFRSQAHSFREKIKELGLYTLQRSVWVYPYDPRNEITFLAKLNGLYNFITIFKASGFEKYEETKLKKFFNLK